MSGTAEERVLFLVLSEDEDGARKMLADFLPNELNDLATAADTLLDLIEEARRNKADAERP